MSESPASLPIAKIAIDTPLLHLDRVFDYRVPPQLAGQLSLGSRVEVKFHGQRLDGWVLGLAEKPDYQGELVDIKRAISAGPVLNVEQIALFRQVADHYIGTFSDVLRLAVPTRVVAVEDYDYARWPAVQLADQPCGGLLDYPNGAGYLAGLAEGHALSGAWQVVPQYLSDIAGPNDWTRGICQAALATLTTGRSVLCLVPDQRHMHQLSAELAKYLPMQAIALLHHDLGQTSRYRNYLAVLRGAAKIVVGTQSAVFAPLHNLGLITIFDDGDDNYVFQRAPYPHTRTVAAMRAVNENAAILFASYNRSCETQAWVDSGWLGDIAFEASQQRWLTAGVRVPDESNAALDADPRAQYARLPKMAFDAIRTGLQQGSVLVQVPRRGYLLSLFCTDCGNRLICGHCFGPLQYDPVQTNALSCRWCGRLADLPWHCKSCRCTDFRAGLRGIERTKEELGKAFPKVRVIESSGERIVEQIDGPNSLVLATPGAEPRCEGGYAALICLDSFLLLERPELRASEEALRRWLNALALVRGGRDGGRCVLVGSSELTPIQAMMNLDPRGLAQLELADRAEVGLPPAVGYVVVQASNEFIVAFTELVELPTEWQLLGPVDCEADIELGVELRQVILRGPRTENKQMAKLIRQAVVSITARGITGVLRIMVDPAKL